MKGFENMKERLYSPVFISIASSDGEYSDPDYQCNPLSHEESLKYFDLVRQEMDAQRINSIPKNGFVKFFDGSQSVKEKINTGFPSIEIHNDKLYMVMELDVNVPLTPSEMEQIKDYLSVSYADGDWQQFIPLGNGQNDESELRVEFNCSEDIDFFIDTRQEFDKRLGHEIEQGFSDGHNFIQHM